MGSLSFVEFDMYDNYRWNFIRDKLSPQGQENIMLSVHQQEAGLYSDFTCNCELSVMQQDRLGYSHWFPLQEVAKTTLN